MPLYSHAEKLIRGNLAVTKRGKKPQLVEIGILTEIQLNAINLHRLARGWEPIHPQIVFHGKHVYESRVLRDGYTENDLLHQIFSAIAEESVFKISQKMTVLQNPALRADGYGARVHDQAVLDCTARHPRAELYSVIPKGDRKPLIKAEGPQLAALLKQMTNSPG